MRELLNPSLNRRHLAPVGWRVRDALSPWVSHAGFRWWALLLCEEGLAALQWPARQYLAANLRIGVVAGTGNHPRVRGDAWPLRPEMDAPSPRALLFPRADIERLEFRRRLWRPSELRLYPTMGRSHRFGALDPVAFVDYPRKLQGFGVVIKTGRWPAG